MSDTSPQANTESSRRGLAWEVLVLAAILFASAAFRSFVNNSDEAGVVYGRHDEAHYVNQVQRYLAGEGELHYFTNPTLSIYVLFAAVSVTGRVSVATGGHDSYAAFIEEATADAYLVTVIGRLLASGLGIASVLLLYVLGRRAFSGAAGVVAAAALGVDYTHASMCALVGSHPLLVFLSVLSWLGLVAYVDRPTLWRACLVGAAFGLTIATKYSAALFVLPFATALAIGSTRGGGGWRALLRIRTWGPLLLVPVFFALGAPQVVSQPGRLLETLQELARFKEEGWLGDREHLGTAYGYFVTQFGVENCGDVFAAFVGLGLLLAAFRVVVRRDAVSGLILLAVIPFYLSLGSSVIRGMRYLLPIVPLLLLLGAMALQQVVAILIAALTRARLSPRVVAASTVAAGVLMLLPFVPAAYSRMTERYGGVDDRTMIARWADEETGASDALWVLAVPPRFNPFPDDSSRTIRDFRDLLEGQPTVAELAQRIGVSGIHDVLIVSSSSVLSSMPTLPRHDTKPLLRDYRHWDDFVALLQAYGGAPGRSSIMRGQLLSAILLSLSPR